MVMTTAELTCHSLRRYVDFKEFSTAISTLKVANVGDAEIESLWKIVDINGDGHLNYLEFCAAFQIEHLNSAHGELALKHIIDAILASLQKNSMSLAYAFR